MTQSKKTSSPHSEPESGARGDRLLVRLDRLASWSDGALKRTFPEELNPLTQLGQAANFVLLVAVASGVLMLFWYSPSVQFAYSSLDGIRGRSLGGIVRGVHRYSSDLLMLLLFIHAFRMFVARKFFGERWLAWVSGVAVMALIWFIGWTGYWLVWDKPAQQVAVASMSFLDALPIFGEPLGRLFIADRLVPSLLFFVVFFTHMLLPLGLALGLAIHLLRISRVKLLPSWKQGACLTFGLLAAAIMYPAPLDSVAAMAEKAESFTVDAWYLSPLALSLRMKSAGLWVALGGAVTLSALVPWIFGRKRKRESYQALVEEPHCHSCSQCSQDCPYDAISLVPRTDGKPFPSVAWVNPARCVGCGVCGGSCDTGGVGISWFETKAEERRILQSVETARGKGGGSWVAFVSAEVDGSLGRFRQAAWESRLEGYEIFAVPTASWVRSSLVEKLLKRGSEGVLVVRDGRAESPSRDGGRWVEDRLEGKREPVFRPKRAGGSEKWKVIDYDPSIEPLAAEQARAFRESESPSETTVGPRPLKSIISATAVFSVLLTASVWPSRITVSNPVSPQPEFVFSFKAFGAFEAAESLVAEEQAKLPVHMRGRSTSKPNRSDTIARLRIDGELREQSFAPKGISRDGPAIGEMRVPLEPGARSISVELLLGDGTDSLQWEGEYEAELRRIAVLTYEPHEGFVQHWEKGNERP